MRYRWVDADTMWTGVVRRVLVDDRHPYAYWGMVERLRHGCGWEVVVPGELGSHVYDDELSARRAVEAARGIDPSEVDA